MIEDHPALEILNQVHQQAGGRVKVSRLLGLAYFALGLKENFTKYDLMERVGVRSVYPGHSISVFLNVFSQNGMLDRSRIPAGDRIYTVTPRLLMLGEQYNDLNLEVVSSLANRSKAVVLRTALGLFALSNELDRVSSADEMGRFADLPPVVVVHNGLEAYTAARGLSEQVVARREELLLVQHHNASTPPAAFPSSKTY